MAQSFFQFNNSVIDEIITFVKSSSDIFFLSGPKGSSKSETIEKVIPELTQENLVFRYFCFENSVIDDFLLNFYDGLKNFSIAGRVSLKKFVTGDFKEKVTHYFKTIDKNCVIIVENFDKVEQNVEISNFLTHLSKFQNVKIIIVSRNPNTVFSNDEIQSFKLEQISKEEFKSKLTILAQVTDNDVKEDFYKIANGLELYLNMSIRYCINTGITIKDLISEFERRGDNFEHFIVSKLISLTPSNYRDFYKMLSFLSYPVSVEFIENYNLGNISYIDYLSKNFLISKFDGEVYVKDYFKEYIKESFTLQEKVNCQNKIIEIYEKELTKSPKDRLLRLSRESIRKELELLKSSVPFLNSKSQSSISYIGMSGFNLDKNTSKPKTVLSEKLNRIKEIKNRISLEDNPILNNEKPKIQKENLPDKTNNPNKTAIIDLINKARMLTSSYNYKEANNSLFKALDMDYSDEFKIELCILIAKNYDSLNEYQAAYEYYEEAKTHAVNTNDSRECEASFLIACLNKKLYQIDIAKEQFASIIINESYYDKYRIMANIELGEIEEAQGNVNNAAKYYENALSLSLGNDKLLTSKSYYKLAVLYDENGDMENAIKYYKKNYTVSSEPSENEYYSISLTNLASIYIEQSKYQQASEFLKLALAYDTENNDLTNMYYSQKELAKLYSRMDSDNAIGYYKQALDIAKQLQDSFKIALVYFETGDFYYDRGEDEKALESFFNAKKALGNNSKDENISRINLRIKDIKMRLSGSDFDLIAEKFDK